jgi:hypothetical protein
MKKSPFFYLVVLIKNMIFNTLRSLTSHPNIEIRHNKTSFYKLNILGECSLMVARSWVREVGRLVTILRWQFSHDGGEMDTKKIENLIYSLFSMSDSCSLNNNKM